ncbi:hypothetical protein LIO03_000709 [Vibrio alginolyticus]|uniref:hypothetical protein n=1 Tax=Vibrio alginolyticus TaxID=663 RepID=UPI00215C5682|nr:hypothetical protein [Vibrio alginolyticus]EIJ2375703.1 hypothetical protein [Vibrio alginolyticus]EJU9539317.1 hypothetical protein [Vibrio alginolyticus]MCR9466628.1 hypothetical protein [Vibrio alginolyticus]MCR9482350.1 hypothetical protein [Vibrio alginolyticus]
MSNTVIDGVIIGGAGGAIAGLTVYAVQALHKWISDKRDSKRVYNWLKSNTELRENRKYRSTRAIASFNNLTEDRVRYLCSHHPKIRLSTGEKEDLWTVF